MQASPPPPLGRAVRSTGSGPQAFYSQMVTELPAARRTTVKLLCNTALQLGNKTLLAVAFKDHREIFTLVGEEKIVSSTEELGYGTVSSK